MLISLPWPRAELSPNARVHHFVKARAKKAYRTGCGWEAMQAFAEAGRPKFLPPAKLSITFHPPDNRRRDMDNMLAAIKSGLDGVADAIGMDDRHWTLSLSVGPVVARGRVVIAIDAAQAIEVRGVVS